MRSIFRKIILASAFGAAVALAGNSAMAATRINVPFNFKVAGATLPAGSYHVVSRFDQQLRHASEPGIVEKLHVDTDPGPSEHIEEDRPQVRRSQRHQGPSIDSIRFADHAASRQEQDNRSRARIPRGSKHRGPLAAKQARKSEGSGFSKRGRSFCRCMIPACEKCICESWRRRLPPPHSSQSHVRATESLGFGR